MAELASVQNDTSATIIRVLGGLFAIPNGDDVYDPVRQEAGQAVAWFNGPGRKLNAESIRPEALVQIGDRMFGAGRRMYTAAIEHQRQWAGTDAEMRKPLDRLDRSNDPERRARFRNLPTGEMMVAIQHADLADLTALTASGNVAALPDEAFAEAEVRYLVENIVEKQALQAMFGPKRTLENPLPDGPDVAGARRQAEGIISGHDANRDLIAIHAQKLQEYSQFLSHVFGLDAADAFKRMVP